MWLWIELTKLIQGHFCLFQFFLFWLSICAKSLLNIFSYWKYINNGTSGRYVSVKRVFMRRLLPFVEPPRLSCTPRHLWKQSNMASHLSRGNCLCTDSQRTCCVLASVQFNCLFSFCSLTVFFCLDFGGSNLFYRACVQIDVFSWYLPFWIEVSPTLTKWLIA